MEGVEGRGHGGLAAEGADDEGGGDERGVERLGCVGRGVGGPAAGAGRADGVGLNGADVRATAGGRGGLVDGGELAGRGGGEEVRRGAEAGVQDRG